MSEYLGSIIVGVEVGLVGLDKNSTKKTRVEGSFLRIESTG